MDDTNRVWRVSLWDPYHSPDASFQAHCYRCAVAGNPACNPFRTDNREIMTLWAMI